MAIEDAATLARCLSGHKEDSRAALRRFESLRQKRTAALTRYSRRYGAIGQAEHPLALRLRDRTLALMPESLAQGLLRMIFDYDVDRLRI
jgi:2-polyprenyl-6-methoxyphenol hydroxylase-like FAD-dependent oxidoreductase